MTDPTARHTAIGLASGGRVRALEEAGIALVWLRDLRRRDDLLRACVEALRASSDVKARDQHAHRARVEMVIAEAGKVLGG